MQRVVWENAGTKGSLFFFVCLLFGCFLNPLVKTGTWCHQAMPYGTAKHIWKLYLPSSTYMDL